MRLPASRNPNLSRRHLLLLAASSLSGCGGGTGTGDPGTNLGGLPGTGGTGIYVAGTISGFGSVILGGIKFDDTAALVTVDGARALSTDLRLGMVAEVLGKRSDLLPAQGTASSIDVWSIAQGPVTAVGTDGLFTVAGMSVRVSVNTVLDGINDQTPLRVGMPVIVWGLQAGGNGATWTATRVAKTTDASKIATTGLVSADHEEDDALSVNAVRLTGSAANSLALGAWVRVQGRLNDEQSLVVQSAKVLQGPAITPDAGSVIEVEGYVTSALVGDQFSMGQWLVDVSAISHPATIAVGDKVEVSGTYAAGVLHATSFTVEDESLVQEVEIEARIQSYTSLSDFVLRGQRCDASEALMAPGVASRLGVGVKVKVHGYKLGEFVKAETLEISS